MDLIPIDNKGCYVKYTFPDDMRLPNEPLQAYLSSTEPGKKMMMSPTTGQTLILKDDVFYEN